MDFDGFYKELNSVDWYYTYSDSASTYRAGEAQVKTIVGSPEQWKRDMVKTYRELQQLKERAWERGKYGKDPIAYVEHAIKLLEGYTLSNDEGSVWLVNKTKEFYDTHYAKGVLRSAVDSLELLIDVVHEIYHKQFDSYGIDSFLLRHNASLRKNEKAFTKSRVSVRYLAVSDALMGAMVELKRVIRTNPNVYKVWYESKSRDSVDDVFYTDNRVDYHINSAIHCRPEEDVTITATDALIVGKLVLLD